MSKQQQMCGIVLFGFGRAGQIHYGNIALSARARLLYIVDPLVEQVERTAERCGAQVLHPDDAETALKDPAVNAVIVASPTFSHRQWVVASLNAGKSVFCEKPIGLTLEEIRECYSLAETKKLPLFCAFNRRFDHSFSQLRQRVKQGEIGDIHMIKITSRDSPRPSNEYLKISGGIFHDCGIHDIDMARWISGEDPIEVSVTGHAFDPEIRAMGDVDCCAMTFKFPSGAMALVDLDRFAAYGYDQRVEVFGSKGMLQAENRRPTSVVHSNANGSHQDRLFHTFTDRHERAYQTELEHFFDAVLEGKPLCIDAADCINATIVCEATEQAHKTGQKVVINIR